MIVRETGPCCDRRVFIEFPEGGGGYAGVVGLGVDHEKAAV